MYWKINNDTTYQKQIEQENYWMIQKIGANCRYLRKKRKLSRTKVIEQLYSTYGLKLHLNTLIKIECSRTSNIELKTIAKLALILGTYPNSLMFDSLEYIDNRGFQSVTFS